MIDEKAIQKIRAETGSGVRIVAATKTVPAQTINRLKEFGIMTAGENRVQEFLQKYESVTGTEWHFIGRLQTNKVKYIVDKVAMIQSVDRPALVDEIQKQCAKIDKPMDILLEVNTGEDTKGGVAWDGVLRLAEYAAGQSHIRIKGLMCIPPPNCSADIYKNMYNLFERLKSDFEGAEWLSMGMSADYCIAVQNGANMIRPGSALFGARS